MNTNQGKNFAYPFTQIHSHTRIYIFLILTMSLVLNSVSLNTKDQSNKYFEPREARGGIRMLSGGPGLISLGCKYLLRLEFYF